MIFIPDDDAGVRDSLRLLLECDADPRRSPATGEARSVRDAIKTTDGNASVHLRKL